MAYQLDEQGINQMLSDYAGSDCEYELRQAVEQFKADMIAEAENMYEWEEESGTVDDGYYDLCEPLEGEMTLDAAISRLNSPGWGFTTDAMRVIEDFEGNVRNAIGTDWNQPVFQY